MQLSNTVLHESLHGKIWVDGLVDFNESLANFVGHAANIDFYQHALSACAQEDCRNKTQARLAKSRAALENALRFSKIITDLFNELSALYSSSQSKQAKLAERERIFERQIGPLRLKNPKMRDFSKINNAEIMQHKLYFTGLRNFDKLFNSCSREWNCFFSEAKKRSKEFKTRPWLELFMD